MITRYKEHAYICQDRYIELQIYPSYRQNRGRRRKRYKPTSEVQAVLNENNRQKKFVRYANHNFTENDVYVTLTYRDELNPESIEEAKNNDKNFLKRLNRIRVKKGLPKAKWMRVIEKGKRKGRIHHHFIMSGGITPEELKKIWGNGIVQVSGLVFDEQTGIENLANYMLKRECDESSWSHSRNLVLPAESKATGRLSNKALEWMSSYTDYSELEKNYPGYRIISVEPVLSDVNGRWYFFCKLYKPPKARSKR